MKVTLAKPTSLDLKDLMGTTVPTINKRIRGILQPIVKDELIDRVLVRAREIRLLIRNDAGATMRLIETAPEKEAVYRELWAAQANKLLAEIGSMFQKVARGYSVQLSEECAFAADEVVSFAPVPPAQVPIEDLDFHLKDEVPPAPEVKDEASEKPLGLADFEEEPEQEEQEEPEQEEVPA